MGIVQNHVYTVLGVVEIEDNKLYRIRNPWAEDSYKGPWADKDVYNWDPFLKSQVSYIDKDDGIFFIDFVTYHREFDLTQIHVDTMEMTQSYYLVTDDNTPNRPNPAESPFCNENRDHC